MNLTTSLGSRVRGGLTRGLAAIGVAALLSAGAVAAVDAASSPNARETGPAPAQTSADIVDTAVAAGSFTTLAAALEAADLIGTLKGEGPFTVFAPTDEAFAKLPAGTVEALLADVPALTDILLYHVVSGAVGAADVVQLSEAGTVQGQPVSIAVVDGSVVLNGSVNVVTTDIVASNGIIHVIDEVLLPPVATTQVTPPDAGQAGLVGGAGSSTLAVAGALALAGVALLGGRLLTAGARAR
jgi:uncharacterized surface protein with fasciclin (FAS1) repeats